MKLHLTSVRVLAVLLLLIGGTMFVLTSFRRQTPPGAVLPRGDKRSAAAEYARNLLQKFNWAAPPDTEELKLVNNTAQHKPVKHLLEGKGRAGGTGMRGSAKSVSMTWNDDNKSMLKRHAAGRYLFCFYNNTGSVMRAPQVVESLADDPQIKNLPKGFSPDSVFFKFLNKQPPKLHPDHMDPVEVALERLASAGLESSEWNNTMHLFVAVGDPGAVMDFQAILPDDFLESDQWPSFFYLDVVHGFKKFSKPLNTGLPAETVALLQTGTLSDLEKASEISDVLFEAGKAFMRNIFDGKEDPFIRSEFMDDNQYKNADGDVIHAVNAIYFRNVLMNPSHPATPPEFFVTFHAPWCGHCKRFESFFKPFAVQMQKVSKRVGFYKMDVTKNDILHPALQRVTRVPAVFYFKKKNLNKPIPYLQKIDDPIEAAAEFVFKNSDLGSHLRRSWEKVVRGEGLEPGEL